MKLLAQILTLYNWGVACILMLFLFGIARFFEQRLIKKTTSEQQRSFYPLILIPVVLFAASAVVYALSEPLIVGNLTADVLRIIASIILGFTGYSLLNTMIGGRS
jgi:hypothetical protein